MMRRPYFDGPRNSLTNIIVARAVAGENNQLSYVTHDQKLRLNPNKDHLTPGEGLSQPCKACGKRGADVRPDFNWNANGLSARQKCCAV
jgi:hypothetical protein